MAEFIDITEPRSPLGTENILRPYKRGEAEITVDVCTGVLRGVPLKDMPPFPPVSILYSDICRSFYHLSTFHLISDIA